MKKSQILDNIIEIELDDGRKVDADILFTFNENSDQYILYEIDNVAYGAKVLDDNKLIAINDDEWNLVEKIFNEWMENQDDEDDEFEEEV